MDMLHKKGQFLKKCPHPWTLGDPTRGPNSCLTVFSQVQHKEAIASQAKEWSGELQACKGVFLHQFEFKLPNHNSYFE